ncbi:MAG: hypothetical protein ACYS9X_16950, partial [Planctomycetota bacterium]
RTLLALLLTYVVVPALILASAVRRSLLGPLTRPEACVAYVVSFLALTALAFVWTSPYASPTFAALVWIAAPGAVVALAMTTRSRVPRSVHAHVALLTAWVVNAAFAVPGALIWGSPGPGFYCTVVSIPFLVAEAVVRTRDALRGEGEAPHARAASAGGTERRSSRLRETAFAVAAVPAVGVLALPFVKGVTPALVLVEPYLWECQALAPVVVACLAVPILASTVRQALFGPLTRWEVRAAYALALGALAATASLVVMLMGDDAIIQLADGVKAAGCPSAFLLAIGVAVVLVATRKGRVPPGTHAHVAMLVAWMPNAAFCILLFSQAYRLGAGFYLAILAFVAYAVEAGARVRATLRSDGEAGAEAQRS